MQQSGFSESPKGLPFYIFRHCEIFQNDLFFVSKFGLLSEPTRSFRFSFLKNHFFDTLRLFSNLFLSKPPRLLLEMKCLVSIEDSSGFLALCDILRNVFILFPVRKKWFPSLIEHEKHPLCVSKLFSELFIKTSWAYFENFALFEP